MTPTPSSCKSRAPGSTRQLPPVRATDIYFNDTLKKHVLCDDNLPYIYVLSPMSDIFLFVIQTTEFKHSKTRVLLPRTQQKNKEEFVQKLTGEWIREDDGQYNEQVTV